MKRVVIFNFRRDADAIVEVLERSELARKVRLNVKERARLYWLPHWQRRITKRLYTFAAVRLRQLLPEYERAEQNVMRKYDELVAARDHYNRLGRVVDVWTERYAKAGALNAEFHEEIGDCPPRWLEDGEENPAWRAWWKRGGESSARDESERAA